MRFRNLIMNFFHGIKVSSGIVASSRLFEGLTTVCDSQVSSESYKGFENALSSLLWNIRTIVNRLRFSNFVY